MSQTNPDPSHPCAILGETICQRLEELGKDRWWLTKVLAKRLCRAQGAYRKVVDNVCSGRKPLPAAVRDVWASALGWPEESPEYPDFVAQAERASAQATKLGRPALLRLEAQLAEATRDRDRYAAALEASEARRREIESRLLALEADRL